MNLANVFTVTITAPNGPGLTATANVVANVYAIEYNWVELIVYLFVLGNPNPLMYSLSGVTTVTTTIASNTITIS